MKKNWVTLTLPISGHIVKGLVYNRAQLSAKFQIWCRQFDITDRQSLALLTASTETAAIYFNDLDEAITEAKDAINKLPPKKYPIDVSDVSHQPK